MSTRIKLIYKGIQSNTSPRTDVYWNEDYTFICDSACTEYDWLVVYDELPKNSGTIHHETETLKCPKSHTILITVEPESIKIYSKPYTHQFGTVLTTQAPTFMPGTHYKLGRGCIDWFYKKPLEELRKPFHPEKTKILSTVCSSKQQTHTLHKNRYDLTQYLSKKLPEMDWFGWGVKPMNLKNEALDDYKYHIAIENHLSPHHWTEKLADCFLAGCLPFYVGDPCASEIFPPESFIPIPLDNPEEAYHIIKTSIAQDEYTKRLPAIMESRRLILEKYNRYAQVVQVISEISENHTDKTQTVEGKLKGRHTLRKNPLNLLSEGLQLLTLKLKRNK